MSAVNNCFDVLEYFKAIHHFVQLVVVYIPQFLLRILPAPQSKVEERGTQAIRKVILKDAASAMQAVEEAWAKEQDRKRTSNDKYFTSPWRTDNFVSHFRKQR